MKRWCNNVDWSLESVCLNINNSGDSKRIWVGDPLFEYFEEGHFLFLEMVGSPSKCIVNQNDDRPPQNI